MTMTERCAHCKYLMECATRLYNTPIGNWNWDLNDCAKFEKEKRLDFDYTREEVTFT